MARMWRYAAGLLVAGSPLVPGLVGAAGTSSTTAATVDPMDSFQEMRLECLVLADPAIGETRLSFRRTGDMLEVRGTCESVSARRVAIDLISREHKGSVRDLTTIAVIPSQPKKPMQSAALQKMAARRIKELVPSQAGAIQVESPEAGLLVVSGLSLSMEDKVEVSRNLKKLAGVVAVRNDLRVSPMIREGKMVTLVTSDGRRVLDGATGSVRPSAQSRVAETAVATKPPANPALQRVAANGEEVLVEKRTTATKPRDAQPPEEVARAAVTEALRGRLQPDQSRLWQPPPTVTVGGKPVVLPNSGLDSRSATYATAHAPTYGDAKAIAWRNKNIGLPADPVFVEARRLPVDKATVAVPTALAKPAGPSAPKASEARRPASVPELMPPPSLPASVPVISAPVAAPVHAPAIMDKPAVPSPTKATEGLKPAPVPELMPPPSLPASAPVISAPVAAPVHVPAIMDKPAAPSPTKATESLKPAPVPELMPPPSLPVSVPALPSPVPTKVNPQPLKTVSATETVAKPSLPKVTPAAVAPPTVVNPVPARMTEEPVPARMIEEPETPEPTASPSGNLPKISISSPAELKKSVEKACGRFAKKVTVTKSDGNFIVSIIVRGPLDEKAVIDRMLSIPEALSPLVRFEVRQGE